MNAYMQIKLPDPMIQVRSNDNAITVVGATAGGHQNKSFLKDDPELQPKLTGLIDDMKTHQRGQLVSHCGEQAPALDAFDEQMQQLEEELTKFFNSNNTGD